MATNPWTKFSTYQRFQTNLTKKPPTPRITLLSNAVGIGLYSPFTIAMGCATYAGQPLKAVAIGTKALKRETHTTLVYIELPSEYYDYSTLVVFPLQKGIL